MSTFVDLTQDDDMPEVRKAAAATNLGKFAATTESAYLKSTDKKTMFVDLTQEDDVEQEINCERSMAKRKKVQRERDVKVQHSSIDRISTLPEETLLFILSLMSMEDAAKTSVLSRRWRYLWRLTPTLDFDGTSFLWKVASTVKTGQSFFQISEARAVRRALEEQRCSYIRWVNSVITSHKANTVERFRLFFNLTKFHKQHIDGWLRHVVARKVRALELDLTYDCSVRGSEFYQRYEFPREHLHDGSIDFQFLEKLCTHCVDVNGEAVDFFIRNCPRLEHVSICRSNVLTSLKIIKPFPALKRLEICMCQKLDSVEIRDAGVVYLKYYGSKIGHFVLENVPLLTELCIDGPIIHSMAHVLLYFSKHFPQLEKLKLFSSIGSNGFTMEDTELFYSTAKLTCLKELVVNLNLRQEKSLLPLTNLIRAAPYLQKFVVERWFMHDVKGVPKFELGETNFEKMVGHVYPHLKEVEFVGYSGATKEIATKEVELVMQLLHGASSLQKIIVNPRGVGNYLIMFQESLMKRVLDGEIDARFRAKQQLVKRVPPGIILEIL